MHTRKRLTEEAAIDVVFAILLGPLALDADQHRLHIGLGKGLIRERVAIVLELQPRRSVKQLVTGERHRLGGQVACIACAPKKGQTHGFGWRGSKSVRPAVASLKGMG